MDKARFPHQIKRGSTTVRIYKIVRKTGQVVYSVIWTVQGQRNQNQFSKFNKAKTHANLVADQLNAGQIAVAQSLNADDTAVLAQARKICGDRPILSVLVEHQNARKLVGDDLMEACRFWAERNVGGVTKITFADAVKRFMKAKERSGIDGSGYRRIYPRMVPHFQKRMIGTITAAELDEMIHREFGTGKPIAHPASYNSCRTKLVTLFRWCRKQGYLPAERQTEPERLERARESERIPGIIHVADLARILRFIDAAHPELLGVTVLSNFAGMRRAEVQAQFWEDIDLERGILRVTAGKRGTPARRLIHLCPAAVQWLLKCERKGEPVSPNDKCERTQERVSPDNYAVNAVRTLLKEAGFKLPPNAFRHGWISHKVAATQDINATALEGGNSPNIIRRHYLELVSQPDGIEWFGLSPQRVAQIDGKVVSYG